MTLDEYLNLTDDEINFLVGYEYGVILNNPWNGSVLNGKVPRGGDIEDQDKDDEGDPDGDGKGPTLMDEVTEEEKLDDLDQEAAPE